MKIKRLTTIHARWIVANMALLLGLACSSAFAVTVTKTVNPPGLVSVDGCGTFCSTLPSVSFDAADFGPASEITDVDVSITWFKTDGSCNAPGTGNSFHAETSFRLDGPSATNVVIANPGTWSGGTDITSVTTVFDQAAGAVPSGTPVSGTFLPNTGNLNSFNGLSGTSTWELRAGDNGAGDPLCIDSYSVTVTAIPVVADLSITKTDGVASATAGGSVTYTITASNAGPSAALGNAVTDTFPAACTATTWTCVGAGGGTCSAAGSGNIADTVDLPAGASVTYTAACNIDPAATGTLSNTATVLPSAGVSDPNITNNSATDTDTLTATADLAITKTDGVTDAIPGGSVTYTIVASNAGPSAALGSTVIDFFPSVCSAVNWTCVGAGGGTCTAAASGNILDTVDLPAGASVTYTAVCNIDPAAAGVLDNIASVTPAAGVSDPNNGNNDATDIDTLVPSHDLAITKTDGVTSATPGDSVTYTIVASNAGPSDAVNSDVDDIFPAACTAVSWTCVGAGGGTCTAAGSGNIADMVNLPVGGSATYTASCDIDPAATGTLDNVAAISSIDDPNNGNNNATDSDTLVASADLSITKVAQAVPDPIIAGSSFNYLLTVSNSGPSTATGVLVEDNLPANLDYVTDDCGASFVDPLVSWSIGSLAPAASVSCTITVTVNAAGAINNTATVTSSSADPTPANDSASSLLGGAESADVAIELDTDIITSPNIGDTFAYLVTLTNNGPGLASDLDVSLMLSTSVGYVTDTCGGFLVGDTLNWTVPSLANGASVTCQVDVVALLPVPADSTATVVTASFDPNLANNTTALQTAIGALAVPALSMAGLLLMVLLLGFVAVRRLV